MTGEPSKHPQAGAGPEAAGGHGRSRDQSGFEQPLDQDSSVATKHAKWHVNPIGDDSRTQLPSWDLNKKVLELIKRLRRTGRETCFEDLRKADQKALKYCDELVDFFLWKVCLHETHQVEVAATAVTEARLALFALVDEAANGNLLRRLFRSLTLEIVPPNVWLYWRVQEKLEELHNAFGPLQSSMKHDRLAAPVNMQREPDKLRAELKETCPLHTLRRRRRLNRRGKVRETGDWHPEKRCRRACDLLLLFELCLRVQEIAKAIGLSPSTIQSKLMFCGAGLNDKRAKAAAEAANPAPPNPRKNHD